MHEARLQAVGHATLLEKEKLREFGCAVLRTQPAQRTTLCAAGAIGECGRQLREALWRRVRVHELEQRRFGALHRHTGRHRKQDVAQTSLLALREARLVRLVVARAGFGRGLGRLDRHLQHGLDGLLLLGAQGGRQRTAVIGQPALAHGFLAQQFGPGPFAHGLQRFAGADVQALAVDAHFGQGGRGEGRRGGVGDGRAAAAMARATFTGGFGVFERSVVHGRSPSAQRPRVGRPRRRLRTTW